jgi:hypothetical protein
VETKHAQTHVDSFLIEVDDGEVDTSTYYHRSLENKGFGWVLTKESGLKAFATLSNKTLGEQPRAVLGYFRHGLTSGVIEGINSKIAKIQFQMRGISSIRQSGSCISNYENPPARSSGQNWCRYVPSHKI